MCDLLCLSLLLFLLVYSISRLFVNGFFHVAFTLCLFLTFVVPRFQYLIYKRFNQVEVWNTNKSFVCMKCSPGTNGNNFRHFLCSFTRYNKYIIKLALLCSMVYLSDCNAPRSCGCRRSLKRYSSSCYAVFGFLQTWCCTS